MHADFDLKVLWAERENVANPAEYAAVMGHFAVRLQHFCRAMVGVDERFANLRRGRSNVNFADLSTAEATTFVRNDGAVTSLNDVTTQGYIRLSIMSGIGSVMAGGVRLGADGAFWRDEARIRRVAEALIDFWRADQACVYTLALPNGERRHRNPWCFWLDWRRTPDMPTLLPDVAVSGRPSIERAWHGGVERLWPEYAPWKHVEASGTIQPG